MDEQSMMVKPAGFQCRDGLHSCKQQSMGMRPWLIDSVPVACRFFNKTHEVWVGRVAMLGVVFRAL